MGNYKVYCHTNKINNKQYIGVTSQRLNRRFRGGKGYSNCTHFDRAIHKYGWDSFHTKVLFDNLTLEQAEKIEIDLIEKLGTLSPNGYNLEGGGNVKKEVSASTRLKISKSRRASNVGYRGLNQYDRDYNLIKKWDSMASVNRELGIDSSSIRKVCNRENHHAGGYVWRYVDDVQFTKDEVRRKMILDEWKMLVDKASERGSYFTRRVKCITTDMIFDSLTDGAIYYGVDTSSISKVCRGKLNFTGEFNGEKLVWGYVD